MEPWQFYFQMQSQSIQNKWSISFISSHVSDAELIHGAYLRGFAPVLGHKYKVLFLISSSHSLFHNPGYVRDFNPLAPQGFMQPQHQVTSLQSPKFGWLLIVL